MWEEITNKLAKIVIAEYWAMSFLGMDKKTTEDFLKQKINEAYNKGFHDAAEGEWRLTKQPKLKTS